MKIEYKKQFPDMPMIGILMVLFVVVVLFTYIAGRMEYGEELPRNQLCALNMVAHPEQP